MLQVCFTKFHHKLDFKGKIVDMKYEAIIWLE